MSGMFQSATMFNNGGSPSINNWNTIKVTGMGGMFAHASSFNQPIGSWSTGLVTSMGGTGASSGTFEGATVFNQDIGNWNVGNVTHMGRMFISATAFNNGESPSIDNWNTSKVTNMGQMFLSSQAFNQPVGSWNTSMVTSFGKMFQGATSFNNGGLNTLNNWNTSSVTNMNGMFYGAPSFNQNIGSWNTANVTIFGGGFGGDGMFSGATSFNCGELPGVVHTHMQRTATSGWRVEGVTSDNMRNMFGGAASFAGDISNWCVSGIASLPTNFAAGPTNANWTTALRPTWGSCPFPD
jgi:surface protein